MFLDPPIVALFDVDGTLVRTEGRSRHNHAFRAAFESVFGQECRYLPGMHGMTDRQIFMTLGQNMGLGNESAQAMAVAACQTMVEMYQAIEGSEGRYIAMQGVEAALDALAARRVLLGLVTGNAQEIAQDKLVAAGLAEYFSFGAFGTEAEHRSALPPLAVARAEAIAGRPVDPRRVFVIGDTPRDVACALDNGLRAVAVATGHIGMDELLGLGADLVVADLQDPGPLLRLMGYAFPSELVME